jgi:hypothetical protein
VTYPSFTQSINHATRDSRGKLSVCWRDDGRVMLQVYVTPRNVYVERDLWLLLGLRGELEVELRGEADGTVTLLGVRVAGEFAA